MGTQSSGQGHASVIAELIARRLSCTSDQIRVIQGDTRNVPFGNGTGASRSTSAGGSAAVIAAERFIEATSLLIARMTNASANDVRFDAGIWSVGERRYDLATLHRLALETDTLADLCVTGTFKPTDGTYPYGCSICEVEIDPQTGDLTIPKYVTLHDVGCAISPQLIEGQVHGSTLQGLGQALREEIIFDASGQMITGSFMDYAMPLASMIPHEFICGHVEHPSPANPLGAKGVGESGTTTAPAALINAIIDALRPLGVEDITMPATPKAIWNAIRNAKQTRGGKTT
jgi:carbon-monoxide dehydrogenase large subunit